MVARAIFYLYSQAAGGTGTYAYDGNGNMITDNHKKITIAYNHLNLPKKITYTVTGNWIEFTYDATGRKLTKTTNTGVIKNYIGAIEYSGANLEAIYHSEGRLAPNGAAFYTEYAIKDHLGNNRLMFRANGASTQILQESHQHPFGMEMEASYYAAQVGTENGYKYNGKELNEDFGLNWYDYGARWYMPDIGRFNSIDPLADTVPTWSPYHYTYNNPIRFIDPTGMSVDSLIIGGAAANDYVNFVQESLGLGYDVTRSPTNKLRISANNNVEGSTEQQAAFARLLLPIVNDATGDATINAVAGDASVIIGQAGATQQIIDMQDIRAIGNGAGVISPQGALLHESIEGASIQVNGRTTMSSHLRASGIEDIYNGGIQTSPIRLPVPGGIEVPYKSNRFLPNFDLSVIIEVTGGNVTGVRN